MRNHRPIARPLALCALIASASLPATFVQAQSSSGERSSTVPAYHLVQLAVDADKVDMDQFKAGTEAIRSCDDAMKLARTLSADVKRNRFVRASNLPEELQDILRDLPTGHATPLFGTDGNVRVLVICNRL